MYTNQSNQQDIQSIVLCVLRYCAFVVSSYIVLPLLLYEQFIILVTFYCALSIETGLMMDFELEGMYLGIFLIVVNLAITVLAFSFAWTKLKEQKDIQKKKEWKVVKA